MRNRTSGFTLVELLVTIAIVVLLTAVAIPSFNSMIVSTRMASEVNALLTTLNYARSEATKRGQQVSVCPVSGSACATGTSWTAGWQVFQPDSNTQLSISQGIGNGVTLTSTLNTYPVFTPMGYTFFSGTLSLRDRSNNPSLARCIVFDAGSWSVQRGASCP